jgi:hypothetical protein
MIKRKIKLFAFSSVLLLAILACSALGNGAPQEAGDSSPPAVETQPGPTQPPPEPTEEPPPTQAPPEALEPTASPEGDGAAPAQDLPPIEILMVNGFLDNFETWTVVGLVRNNTDNTLDNIEVEVAIFDAAGNELFSETTFADLFYLSPGEITPFSLKIYEELPDADNFIANVVGNSIADIERTTLDVENLAFVVDDNGDTHITGELFNNTSEPAFINSLAGATFDASGQIVSADFYNVSVRYLDPNDSGPFRISITGPQAGVDEIDHYEVYVDAETDLEIEPARIIISDAFNYLDFFENLHLVGEITNQDERYLNIRLIAGIYDAQGSVLDAAYVDLPISSIAPGERVPFDFDVWGPLNFTAGLFDAAETYSIQVDGYWTWETDIRTIDLATRDDQSEYDTFDITYSGSVVNDSGGMVSNTTILIALRDIQSGEVVGTGIDFIFDDLEAGAAAEYLVYIETPEDFNPDDYEVSIRAVAEVP